MLRLRVLGSVEADVNGVRVGLGGPRQRAVLALLLCARGRVLSADRMIEQVWEGRPPTRALASLQAYVSNLRRILEPGRAPRARAEILVSDATGYAVRVPDEAVDAWRFENAVCRAREATSAREARELIEEALGWWRGPAYAEVADAEWALAEVARLDELRLSAQELLIDALIRDGRWSEAVASAEMLTREHPLREEGWRLLATALWGAGRRGDALDALRRSRRILHDELRLAPGPALVELERAILGRQEDRPFGQREDRPLGQWEDRPLRRRENRPLGRLEDRPAQRMPRPDDRMARREAPPGPVHAARPSGPAPARKPLGPAPARNPLGAAPARKQPGPAPVRKPPTEAPASGTDGPRHPSATAPRTARDADAGPAPSAPSLTDHPAPRADELFVGRDDELRTIERAAREARLTGGVVQITGEPGVGKTRLLGRAVQWLRSEGWQVVVGRCPEFDGAPPAWAWVEALRDLARRVPPQDPEAVAALVGEGADGPGGPADAVAGRFSLHRAVAAWTARAVTEAGPLAVVLDDLHRADIETLALLEHLTATDGPPLLVLTAHRPTEAARRLTGTLAQLAARSPHRIALGGLADDDVRALVAAVCAAPVDRHTLAALTERTGGNPFYVRESARLLASEGSLVALSEVPQGVRDVLRRRLARLPAYAFEVLRLTAVVGREAEVEVLVRASEAGEEAVLEGLEAAVAAGLLVEPGPGRVRFAHALVRDTLYTDLTRLRRGRTHARIAEALGELRPAGSTALAHHCARSGTAALAPLAVEHGLRAAELAERRYAHDAAVRMLEQVVESYERIPAPGGDRDARRVELLGKLLRAQVRAGTTLAARRTRGQAIEIAEQAGREDLLTAALTGWQVPTPWQTRPYGFVDRPLVAALERLLAADRTDLGTRCLLLDTLVAELAGEDDAARVVTAARELVAVARRTDDPALLALALASAAKCRSYERAVAFRARTSAELRPLAERLDLPVYRWVCEFIDGSVAGALGDPHALRRHAEAGLELARRYRLVEPEAVHQASLAMLAHVRGDFDEAVRGYDEVGALMHRHGMMHAQNFHELGLITVGLGKGPGLEPGTEAAELARERYERNGPIDGDTYALVLARQGRIAEARAIRRAPLRHDHHHTRNTGIRAELAALLGLRAEAPELIRQLLPVRDQLSGAAYTVFAMRPVAHYLGLLHRLTGDEQAAVRSFERAETVARRWGAEHWAAAARDERDR
ncbi:BTAD domain-containing putative transcriptional regulator [Streptomyces griseorubiginosus]|uniref:BTAD domain-containing putative transcriptional regulator n=1 Tax=Streptomyces griseorubiginosus TaxID=67304 RepID=UPI0036E1E625